LKRIKRKIYTISKKTGDRFGFDLPYFVENGFWVVLSQLVQMGAAFAASVVFARYLTKETFGEYQLVISILGLLALFSYPGMSISILRSVAKGFDYSYVRAARFSFYRTLLTIPVFLGLAVWYYLQDNEQLAIVFIAAGMLFSFIHGLDKWPSFWRAKEQFDRSAKQEMIQVVTLNALLILAAIYFSKHVLVICGIYLLVYSVFNSLWHYNAKQSIKDTNLDEDCIPYGKYMTKMTILTGLILYFDKIVLGFFDLKLLAVYGIALKLFDIFKQVLKSFYSVSSNKFVKKDVTIGTDKVLLLFAIGVVISVLLYLISEPFIVYFYTDQYLEAVRVFKKLVFALPFVFVSPLFSYKANALKEKGKIVHTYVTVPIIAIVSSVLVFVFTKNAEYFVITKVYVMQVLFFLVLVPIVNKR
jgi:O-antigen/teichoic acid export membrane protein